MKNAIEKAGEIIRNRSAFSPTVGVNNDHYCVLAQEDVDGMLTASVITASKSDGIQWINFCTGLGSNKSKRIKRDSRAAVCFESDSYSITLKGRLEILTDAETKRENWYSGIENHFSGPDDPNYCVLRFTTEKYSLFVDWEEITGDVT